MKIVNEMTHPIIPLAGTGKAKARWQFNLPTGDNVLVYQADYDLHMPCLRMNCAFESPTTYVKELDEKLRKAIIQYLEEMKTMLGISLNLLLMSWMNSMVEGIDDMSLEELEVQKIQDDLMKNL